MLTVDEFSAGELSTMNPISLLRPIASHDQEVLVAGSHEVPIAVILHEENIYEWFKVEESSDWSGLIIPNLTIELDETSAFDARYEDPPFGAAVRKGSELAICVKRQKIRGIPSIPLVSGLSSVGDSQVGFRRWQLVLGEGDRKRIMRSFDVAKPVLR